MKTIRYIFSLLLLLSLISCGTDDDSQAVFSDADYPKIFLSPAWAVSFAVNDGDKITFNPVVSPNDGALYKWTINNEVVGTQKDLDYTINKGKGVYTLNFEVTRHGVKSLRTAKMEVK